MHPTDPQINRQLLHRIAEGDEPSFRLLYDEYFNTIYSTALAFTQNSQLAMEVVQETFLRVWKNRARLPEIENLSGFLFVIGRNQVKTALRTARENNQAESLLNVCDQPSPYSPEKAAIMKQFREEVYKAADQLPDQQATVFRLSRFEQLSYEEIATQLGISTATVKNHLVKALGFMRTYFASRYKHLLPFALLIIEKNI
ncbi:RNA polymerase sigma factor [Pseudobacter ginsenosidimutans]|uniref:RNA polymerase sigma-70 factor (ECF subfamily) n=1 Tax=Pseudobacter ginsenosidimutans TaxID=661488 RepID=A0A4Q7MLW4_9BACT|nr:RNA polymerase sigma-70 factor [Pseudobacter ginsenosidimutans]QEC45680.1 RNA polymerase sigma-70 factor [Pseudobacter ginsenosidimutans]RZS69385.1 RNA polymerase sigma-70 factor (ECF subfamily) [Pseudobacter ginsenosidimutans]